MNMFTASLCSYSIFYGVTSRKGDQKRDKLMSNVVESSFYPLYKG